MDEPLHPPDLSPEETIRRLRALLEATQDIVIVLDPDGRFIDAAPTRPDQPHPPLEDFLGRTPSDILPREQAASFQQAFERILRSGQVETIEYMLPIGDEELWFEGQLSPMLDTKGEVTAVLLVARDITAHRQALLALQESESQYRTLVEQSNDAIYFLFNRSFEFINRRFTEMLGVTPEEARSPDFDFMSLVAPQSRPLIEERTRKIEEEEPLAQRYEFTALTKDGREIEVEVSVAYTPYRGGIATQGILRDITERKQFEEQLERRGRYLACLAEIAQDLLRAPDPFTVLPAVLESLGQTAGASRVYLFENDQDAEGRLLISQRAGWHAPGIPLEQAQMQGLLLSGGPFEHWGEALAQNQMIVGHSADFPDAERQHLQAQGIQSILVLPLFVGGSWYGFIGFDVCGAPREWGQIEIDLLATAAHDIAQAIERSQALQALQESEDRYRRLVELLPDGVAVHQDGVLRMVNQIGAKSLGYDSPEEIIGQPVLQFVHPEDRSAAIKRIQALLAREDRAPPLEERFIHQDGTIVPVEVSAAPFILEGRPAVLTVVRDITARKRLEEQLRQAQKMEAIGRLAGGVAHDFNNLLTAINGYADLLLGMMSIDDPLRKEVEAIHRAGTRAARLTQQLLAFSRRQVMEMKVVDLNRLLKDLAGMLRRIISEDIDLVVSLAPELGNVRVDPTQMEQVIVNLAANARDAMPGGGRLVLETANVALDETYTQDHAEVTPGQYVLLSVSDTGQGISPEALEHLFEPFFTTKEGGTGLGLAMVYGIVKQFSGHVAVYSELGQGSTFKIYLPHVEEPAGLPALPVVGEWPRGSETVLLVEDNEMVRNLASRVLSRQGYTVLEARQGDEALQIAGEHRAPIHLLLTDVVMPQMSGRALLERLQQTRPDVRVLYMSGYTDDIIAHHGVLEPGTPFIQKPFTPQALIQQVRAILDQPT